MVFGCVFSHCSCSGRALADGPILGRTIPNSDFDDLPKIKKVFLKSKFQKKILKFLKLKLTETPVAIVTSLFVGVD